MENMYYPNMFSPLKVGKMILRNRVIAAPVGKLFNWMSPSDDFEVFAAKVRGGAALIHIGCICVDDDRASIVHQDTTIGGNLAVHSELVSIAHQYGAKISAELCHCGMFATPEVDARDPIGPDTFIREPGDYQGIEGVEHNQIMDGRLVRGMTIEDMNEVADAYARSAVMAKRVGYDMCLLHFGHGWLPAEFLSPFFNHRTDEFGGSIENRMKFPEMIIDRVRAAVGPDFPLDMRISLYEWVPGGIQPEDAIKFIVKVQDKIDMVHVSSGIDKFLSTTARLETPSVFPRMQNVKYAEMVKKAVHIPVCVVAGIGLPEEIESIISEGKADCVAMARQLIADPEMPNKARLGLREDVVPCLRCVNCYHVATEGISQGCTVNPYYGRVARLTRQVQAPEKRKRVVIVGGGCAGMKAAITAADRGHEVILFEKEHTLGGLMHTSHKDSAKTDMQNYEKYLICQTMKCGADVRLGTEATPEMIEDLHPDHLILALGSVPAKPRIKGIDLPHVMDAIEGHMEPEKTGERVVILGAGQAGCELAMQLSGMGRKAVLVEMAGEMCSGINLLYKQAVKDLITADDNISLYVNTAAQEITEKEVRVKQYGKEFSIPADSVIYCTGMRSCSTEEFMNIVYDARVIGDCLRPRRLTEATHEGFFAGAMI